jgi:hypothetical protein
MGEGERGRAGEVGKVGEWMGGWVGEMMGWVEM